METRHHLTGCSTTISFYHGRGKTAAAYTRMCPSEPSSERGLTKGAGDAAKLGRGLVLVAMDEDIGTGLGAYRGEGVDGGERGRSMVAPNAVFLSPSQRGSLEAVSNRRSRPE
jgi:hypothetical protein